jgi:tripartite-type tricarboxylate transporter receptor subunit TctC
MEYFMRAAGIDLVHIPYKGGAGAATLAILGGEVSAVMTSVSAVLPHVRANKLRALGVVAKQRLSVLPETPTMVESGFPAMQAGAWQGVYLPLGTPKPIVAKLFADVTRMMADPEIVRRLNETGSEVVVSRTPEEFPAFMKAENEFYAKLVKEINLVLE